MAITGYPRLGGYPRPRRRRPLNTPVPGSQGPIGSPERPLGLVNAQLGQPSRGPVDPTQSLVKPYQQGSNAASVGNRTPGPIGPTNPLTNAQTVGQGSRGPIGPNQGTQRPGGPGPSWDRHYKPPRRAPDRPIPLPIDPIYNEEVDRIHRALANTEAELTYQGQQAGQEYGLDDPTNPFSRAALLQRHYQQAQTGARNQMAARGQLYSGATSNAFGSNAFNYQQGYDVLQRGYQGVLHDISQRRAQAGYTQEDALRQAYEDRVRRALANRPDTPPGNPPKKYGGFHPGGGKGHGKHHHKPRTNAQSVGTHSTGPIKPGQGRRRARKGRTNAQSIHDFDRGAIPTRRRKGNR